jgi:hypothetical protein
MRFEAGSICTGPNTGGPTMLDTEEKRQRRDELNRRLDSYYEKLMQIATDSAERWERVLGEAHPHDER